MVVEKVDEGESLLRDHWPFNEDELIRLCDLCFTWKSENVDQHEVLMVGGDIHIGVTSRIYDNETGFLCPSCQQNHVTLMFITC